MAAPRATNRAISNGSSNNRVAAFARQWFGSQRASSRPAALVATASTQAPTKGVATNQAVAGLCVACQSASCRAQSPVPTPNAPPAPHPNATTQSAERDLRSVCANSAAVTAAPASSVARMGNESACAFSGASDIGRRSVASRDPVRDCCPIPRPARRGKRAALPARTFAGQARQVDAMNPMPRRSRTSGLTRCSPSSCARNSSGPNSAARTST